MRLVLCGDTTPVRPLINLPAATKDIFRLAAGADLSLGNFEIPLTTAGAPVQKLLNIKASPQIAGSLHELGLRAVTIANNHTVDYGWQGLEDTTRALTSANIKVVGAGADIASASTPLLVETSAAKVGIVALSCLTPTGMSAGPGRPGISALHVETGYEIDPWYQMEEPGDPSVVKIRTKVRDADLRRTLNLISSVRARCDLLIVTVHWGYGSGDQLAEYQLPLAQALIDAGADIIHGHHPHAIHPFGFYKGRPIIFSAGTYLGQQTFLDASPQVHAMWAAMSPDGFVTEIAYDQGNIHSIKLSLTTLDANRLPVPADDESRSRITERLKCLSAPHGASFIWHNGKLEVRPR